MEEKDEMICDFCGKIGFEQGDDNYTAIVCGDEYCQQEFSRIYNDVVDNLGDVYSRRSI